LFGANFQKTQTEQYMASFVPALNVPVNVFSWDPHSVPQPTLSDYQSPGSTRIDQSGLYAMGRFSLADPLKLIVGARLSQWKQQTPSATTKPDTQLTPYGGLVLRRPGLLLHHRGRRQEPGHRGRSERAVDA
jgi:outer membrane receptor for ferric coprogen and ferric-rhodotorulic acid